MNDAAWHVATRQALIASGKAIVEVEGALEELGYSGFVPMQEKFLSVAQGDEDVADFQQFKRERAAEVLSSEKFPGTIEFPGDGYVSPYLGSIRQLGERGLSKTLVGRVVQMDREKALSASIVATNRAREVIIKESLRFNTGIKQFDRYEDVLDTIRATAIHYGAEVPRRITRPVDGRVLFALPLGKDMSIGFTLIKPTSIYRDFILLTWKPFLLRRPPAEAIRLSLGKPENFAQPMLIDLAIIGFGIYERCSTLGEVSNGMAAYIAASQEIVRRMAAR